MNIKGKFVTLKAIEVEDLDVLNVWGNDPEIQYFLGGWHFPTSKNDIQKWYSNQSVSSLNQRFSIHTDDLGLIGTANLVDIDWKNKNAFHGMLLGDKEVRGKGYAVDTVMAVMKYAFEELGLNRLDGSMIEYNEASLKMYLGKCGWKEEGRQRNWYFRKNKFWDKILVGITKEDYLELISNNNYWK
ncbi:MAG: N-acetyltransferase [Flavobacterium sp.]|nr:MAG: N-acetyltransferase [Flavobacterium sp.]